MLSESQVKIKYDNTQYYNNVPTLEFGNTRIVKLV